MLLLPAAAASDVSLRKKAPQIVPGCRAQGNAKSLYMLTDTDLKKLGSMAKTNPQKQ